MSTTGCNERTLMDYCPDIKVVDCTLRDGGLVNNFAFTDEFVKDLYQANIKAGVDYMEFGYKASKELFDVNAYGKWKFCNEEDIRAIVGENNSPLKIAVMADVGRCDYEQDILPKEESVIDMIRVATYIHQIPTAIKMIEDFKQKGYEVCVNIMAVSKVNSDDLAAGLQLLSRSSVDVIYLVDSFGSFYPEQITKLAQQYVDVANASGKIVGMHAHNNQQLAFANTIEACRNGVCLLDATVNGMGRGAGNCYSESLLSFLKNPKYDEVPIIRFIEKHMLKLKAEGVVWGYDLPYLITGILNSHPSIAINFLKENRTDYTSFLHEVMDMH
ncbi:MAG: aldolase catalytic domain-containing protein [Lachnospiraceae bacterium]|nr:aldolase catalytic domain-containing protein [Lachnospiraceae bacterium]